MTWFERHSGPGHQVRGETSRGPQRWECRCGASTVRFAAIWRASDARFRDRLSCYVPSEDEVAAEALERADPLRGGWYDACWTPPYDDLLRWELLYVEPRAS